MPTRTDSLRHAGARASSQCSRARTRARNRPSCPAHPLDDPAARESRVRGAHRQAGPCAALRLRRALRRCARAERCRAGRVRSLRSGARPADEGRRAAEVRQHRLQEEDRVRRSRSRRRRARARAGARDRGGQRLQEPENVELGADIFCNEFGWRGTADARPTPTRCWRSPARRTARRRKRARCATTVGPRST